MAEPIVAAHLDDCEGNGFGVCFSCDGDGRIVFGWTDDEYQNIEESCPDCKGTGRVSCPGCDTCETEEQVYP